MSIGVSSPDVVGTKSKTVMYRKGALIIDAIDVSGNQLVWWGSASSTKEETGELVNTKMVVDEVAPKILKKFPVKASKKK
ncbi:MAG: DUF4136 domain-containing protein [Chitinophagales bacterium]|nr:DUF4136 domain-containing protein [Chitinophagales bacterium]